MLSKSFIIFGIIGVINTSVDVILFVVLHGAGLPIILANIVSTSTALVISYSLNSRYTFSDSGAVTKQRIVRFLGVTLSGLWILQPLIIALVLYVLHNVSYIHTAMAMIVVDPARYDVILAKLVALPFTVVWNYLLYKALVFKQDK